VSTGWIFWPRVVTLGGREVCGKVNVRVLSVCLFWLRRLAISGSGWRPAVLWTIARPPIVQLAEVPPSLTST